MADSSSLSTRASTRRTSSPRPLYSLSQRVRMTPIRVAVAADSRPFSDSSAPGNINLRYVAFTEQLVCAQRHLADAQRRLVEPQRHLVDPQRHLVEPQRHLVEPQRDLDGPQRHLDFFI